jgi:hypothetical protein
MTNDHQPSGRASGRGRRLGRAATIWVGVAGVLIVGGIVAATVWVGQSVAHAVAEKECTPSTSEVSSIMGSSWSFSGRTGPDVQGYTTCQWMHGPGDNSDGVRVIWAPASAKAPNTDGGGPFGLPHKIALSDGTPATISVALHNPSAIPENLGSLIFDRGSRHWIVQLYLVNPPAGGSAAMEHLLLALADGLGGASQTPH